MGWAIFIFSVLFRFCVSFGIFYAIFAVQFLSRQQVRFFTKSVKNSLAQLPG